MRRLLVGVIAVSVSVVAAAGVAVVAWPGSGPQVDARSRAGLTPLIQRYLETKYPTNGVLATEYRGLPRRLFCEVELVETRGQGSTLMAGIVADCEEFTRQGGALLTGDGFRAAMRVTIGTASGAARHVTGVEEPQDGPGRAARLSRMFSEAGLAEVYRIMGEDSDRQIDRLRGRARSAFDLPAEAPVRTV